MTEVVRDPAVMGGDPVIKGTEVLAETIMSCLRSGDTPEQILDHYPSLPVDGIDAVVRWAEKTYGARWKTRT
jgi:uncharacterized protein (DUF433 family)